MGKASRNKAIRRANPKAKNGPGTCLGNFYCMTTRTRLTKDQRKVKQHSNHSKLMNSQNFFDKQERSLGFQEGGSNIPFSHTLAV